jgi:hypothetical protein
MTDRPNGAPGNPAAGPVNLIDREYERDILKLYLSKGTNCQLVGRAGVGKTALLTNVGRIAAELDGKYVVAYADLSDPSCQTVRGLLERMSSEWGIRPPLSRLTDLSERVRKWRQERTRPVLCLDNFEEMLSRDREFTTDFFVDLRGISQAGMTIITASRKALSQMLTWYSQTSPFFSTFQILSLGPWPREVAEKRS